MAILIMTLLSAVRALFAPSNRSESETADAAHALASQVVGSAAVTGNGGSYTYDADSSLFDAIRSVVALIYCAMLLPREGKSPIPSVNLPKDSNGRDAMAKLKAAGYLQVWKNKQVTFVYLSAQKDVRTLPCWACDSENEARDENHRDAESTVATSIVTIGNGSAGLAYEPVLHLCKRHSFAFADAAKSVMVPLAGRAVQKIIDSREKAGDFSTDESVTEMTLPLSQLASTRPLRYVTRSEMAAGVLDLS